MAMSPLGNVVHVNQNMQVQTLLQAQQQHRADFQAFMNMEEFNDKLKELEEVRPTEESAQVDKDGQNGRENEQQKQEALKREQEEDEEVTPPSSNHLLDIKV